MQINECNYCGATLDHSVYKCTNCGGQVKQLASDQDKPKQNNKMRFWGLLFVLIVIGPIIYKTHLDNTATAVTAKLHTNSIQHPAPVPTSESVPVPTSASVPTPAPTERLLVMSTANEQFFTKKVKFAQVLSQITSIKVVTHEFYITYGRYAESLDELGFNAKSFDTGELIRGIQLSKTGEIRIDLDSETFGKRKHLILTPKEIMGGMNIQWSCSSNIERNVVPFQCDSTA